MESFTLKKVNESFYHIDHPNLGVLKELSDYMAFLVPNYMFSTKYKIKAWDGRLKLFQSNLLPSGLYSRFLKFLSANQYHCNFEYTKEPDHTISIDEVQTYCNELLKDWQYKIREDQVSAIYKALCNKSGLIQSPTASGKSILIYTITTMRLLSEQSPILIIVPKVNLVEQLYSDFQDYGFDCRQYVDKIYSGQIQGNKPITISTYQSLIKKGPGYFEKFKTILIDEIHESTRKDTGSVNKIAKQCINADMRLGFTGTVPKDISEFFSTCSFLGPVIFEQLAVDLIDKDILSDLVIVNTNIQYPDSVKHDMYNRSYDDEIKLIESYKSRNNVLDFIFGKAVAKGENALVLVKHLDHLDSVFNYLTVNYPDKKIFKWSGEVSADIKEETRQAMEELDDAIIVGTFSSISTGTNIKKLHYVIFYSPYKSFFRILQSIGRGLRKHATKSKLIVFDCQDNLAFQVTKNKFYKNHSIKHADIRKDIYTAQKFKTIDKTINI